FNSARMPASEERWRSTSKSGGLSARRTTARNQPSSSPWKWAGSVGARRTSSARVAAGSGEGPPKTRDQRAPALALLTELAPPASKGHLSARWRVGLTGALALRPLSPVAEPPPVVLGGHLAEPPVAVVPLQLHRPPARRHLREGVARPDVRPGLVRVSGRVG